MENPSLLQLLSVTSDPKVAVILTCEQCFALLEYDADLLVAGADPAELRPSVSQHLALCSSCQSQINDWIDKLERDNKTSTA